MPMAWGTSPAQSPTGTSVASKQVILILGPCPHLGHKHQWILVSLGMSQNEFPMIPSAHCTLYVPNKIGPGYGPEFP